MMGVNFCIELAVCLLAGFYRPKCSGFHIPYQVGAFAFSVIQLLGFIAVMSQVAWQVFIIFIPVIATCFWYQVCHLTLSQCCLSFILRQGLNDTTICLYVDHTAIFTF